MSANPNEKNFDRISSLGCVGQAGHAGGMYVCMHSHFYHTSMQLRWLTWYHTSRYLRYRIVLYIGTYLEKCTYGTLLTQGMRTPISTISKELRSILLPENPLFPEATSPIIAINGHRHVPKTSMCGTIVCTITSVWIYLLLAWRGSHTQHISDNIYNLITRTSTPTNN